MEYDFSPDELDGMREVQVGHMMDECVIQSAVITYDTMNHEVLTYSVESALMRCGLDMRPGTERHTQDNVQLQYDATVRLPISVTAGAKDRVKVTQRFGEAITPLVFEIVGVKQRGASGVRYMLRRIEL